jgi:hypothetical protein
MTMSLRRYCFSTRRHISALSMLVVALVCSLLFATSCDFVVQITVRNHSSVPITVDINDSGNPGLLAPGNDGQFGTAINNDLRTIRITTPTDRSVNIVESFTRNRGYNVFVTVTGPPLEATVETRSFGQATPADSTPAQ